MVDPWTQWCMWPFHKLLQSVLRTIFSDCTFNQIGNLERVASSIQTKYPKSLRLRAYSFDLSAATDRLPITLQKAVLGPLIGMEAAQA